MNHVDQPVTVVKRRAKVVAVWLFGPPQFGLQSAELNLNRAFASCGRFYFDAFAILVKEEARLAVSQPAAYPAF
jgi:hypothetical protein